MRNFAVPEKPGQHVGAFIGFYFAEAYNDKRFTPRSFVTAYGSVVVGLTESEVEDVKLLKDGEP